MAEFAFRLQKVLEYRRMMEGWAKEAWMEAKARRLEGEADIARIVGIRATSLTAQVERVDQMIALENYLTRLDDEQRASEALAAILREEENSALIEWTKRRQDAEALEKLSERERSQWELDQRRKEQAALDEWAVIRREAA